MTTMKIQELMEDWNLLKHHLLPFCDVMSMMRLCWTNKSLRALLNQPKTVVEWQRQCWFLYQECHCDRNLFYLRAETFCDFAFDWNSTTMCSQFECDMYLRMFGRTVTMLMAQKDQPQQVPSRRLLPFLYPQKDTKRFRAGVFQTWIEDLIIPVPRMVECGVENVFVHPQNHPRMMFTESHEDYAKRVYWRNFHDVDDCSPKQKKSTGFDLWSPVDLVKEYYAKCAKEERDPHDPMDDPNCEGHIAASWARKLMYQTPLGMQHYPLELCMRKQDLEGKAFHDGVDYIDRMFLPINYHNGTRPLLIEHHGPVYFQGVRYENEKGDFINWALSTHALLNGFYSLMWLDVSHHFIKLLTQTLRNLAYEIETDLSLDRLTTRWQYIEHMRSCHTCAHELATHETWESMRDEDALEFLQEGCFSFYHNVIRRTVHQYLEKTLHHSPDAELDPLRSYLTNLLPNMAFMDNPNRTEIQIVVEMHYLLEYGTYLTRFAHVIAPRVSGITASLRRTSMQIYLASALSLMAFAPTWMQSYHWKPSKTNQLISMRVPTINLTQNHRFMMYLQYTHARTMFYHDNPKAMDIDDDNDVSATRSTASTTKKWHQMVMDNVQTKCCQQSGEKEIR